MPFTTRGLSPIYMATNALVWVSAVIVMGIVSYWFSEQINQPDAIIYIEVISVLTVAFFLAAFFIGTYLSYLLLFNLIFSYLWLVATAFAAQMFSHSSSSMQAHAVEAFCFIAFFALLFNVIYTWRYVSRGTGEHTHSTWTGRPRV